MIVDSTGHIASTHCYISVHYLPARCRYFGTKNFFANVFNIKKSSLKYYGPLGFVLFPLHIKEVHNLCT